MSTNKKNDLLVDDATVQHPKDVRGVLIKVFYNFILLRRASKVRKDFWKQTPLSDQKFKRENSA